MVAVLAPERFPVRVVDTEALTSEEPESSRSAVCNDTALVLTFEEPSAVSVPFVAAPETVTSLDPVAVTCRLVADTEVTWTVLEPEASMGNVDTGVAAAMTSAARRR